MKIKTMNNPMNIQHQSKKRNSLFTEKVDFLNKINKALIKLWIFCSLQSTAFAINTNGTPHTNHLANTKFVTGLINLINDAIVILGPIALLSCVGFAIYFLANLNAASETQDKMTWKNKLVTCGKCAVGIVIAAPLLYAITAYFK